MVLLEKLTELIGPIHYIYTGALLLAQITGRGKGKMAFCVQLDKMGQAIEPFLIPRCQALLLYPLQ